MKTTLYFLFSFLALTHIATAQTSDSLRVEQTTEDARISSAEVKRFIRYITRADVEERTLVKAGIWPTSNQIRSYDTRRFQLGTNFSIALEQKLSPTWSVIAGLNGNWSYAEFRDPTFLSRPPNTPATIFDLAPLHGRTYELNVDVGTRYYYTQRRRALGQTRISNFSGNYIAGNVSFMAGEGFRTAVVNRYTGEFGRITSSNNSLDLRQPRFALLYGVQRRLGKFGYFDINAGPELLYQSPNQGTFSFQLNAFIGFGW